VLLGDLGKAAISQSVTAAHRATADTVVLPRGTAVGTAREPPTSSTVQAGLASTAGSTGLSTGRRLLALAVAAAGLLGLLATSVAPPFFGRGAQQLAVHEAMTQSQRLAKSVAQAVAGSAAAFPEVRDSAEALVRNLRSLKSGPGGVPAVPEVPALASGLQALLDPIMPLVDRAAKNAAIVLTHEKTLPQLAEALRAVSRQSTDLLETAETVSSLKLQQGASAAEVYAVGQLVMLTQRIGKSASELLNAEGVSGEAVQLLGKDLNSFNEIAQGVINGNPDLRLPGTRDAQVRERLQQMLAQYEQLRRDADVILGNLQGLVAAREAEDSVVKDSEPLRRGLAELAGRLHAGQVSPWWPLLFCLAIAVAFIARAMPLPSPGDIRRMLQRTP
jgi:twitching motility protein PilJ